MRIKKIGIALIVTFLARLVISCCDCQETKNYQYTFDSFATFNLDNSGMSPIVSDSNISKEAFGLRIELSLSQIASCKRNYFFGFFESYALDCMCPPEIKYIAKDTIT